jgi:hypothetical protein
MSASRIDGVPRIAGTVPDGVSAPLDRAASTHRLLAADFHKECP